MIHEGLLNLRDNQQFIEMGRIPKTGYNKEDRKWKFEEDKIPFIKAAKESLSNFPLLYLPPLTKVVQYNFFIALYSMIQLNYIYCANEKLDDEDYRSIILGDIGAFEDVVTGYRTIFKLFYIDIRPLVKRGYANYRGFYYKNKKAGYPKRILWADYYSTEK